MDRSWNPSDYAKDARFVSDLATPVVHALDPKPGERILDLGCGDGVLTRRLVDTGCEVVGIDASPEMVAAAQCLGLNAKVMDGRKLTFHEEFDAVFSNAALHWMNRPEDVIRGVWNALKPGGRFVGEFGGHGNVTTVIQALDKALSARGLRFEQLNPWYFPTATEYRAQLESERFDVKQCVLVERPTPLDTDLISWLKIFAQTFLKAIPRAEQAAFLQDVSAHCESELWAPERRWIVDYVRLRFVAVKQ